MPPEQFGYRLEHSPYYGYYLTALDHSLPVCPDGGGYATEADAWTAARALYAIRHHIDAIKDSVFIATPDREKGGLSKLQQIERHLSDAKEVIRWQS